MFKRVCNYLVQIGNVPKKDMRGGVHPHAYLFSGVSLTNPERLQEYTV